MAPLEPILELDPLPDNPTRPLVCMDEPPVQLIQETRQPLPAAPGKPAKVDDAYERHGTAHIFMCTEPLNGTRRVPGTAHRTAVDWAHEIRDLLEVDDPPAERVRLVCDHLKTPGIGSLSEACPPAQAQALVKRLEIHHTPKPGSWLTIAELELSALTGQCLDRRMPDMETWHKETMAWE